MSRKEQLALAQLKKEQVLHEQELKRKMSEVQFEKEIIEAQMEEEKAAVNLKVYEEIESQGARSNKNDWQSWYLKIPIWVKSIE